MNKHTVFALVVTTLAFANDLSYASIDLSFAPLVGITGPRIVERGIPVQFQTKETRSEAVNFTAPISVRWTLPDGSISTSGTVNYTPSMSSPNKQVIRLEAWYTGYESSTKVTKTYTLTAFTYNFPVFKLVEVIDSSFFPSKVNLNVVPDSSEDARAAMGKPLEFNWTLPTSPDFIGGVIPLIKANNLNLSSVDGKTAYGLLKAAGSYPFSVIVSDNRGNSQTLSKVFTVSQSNPISMSMVLTKSSKWNRPPVVYTINPKIVGGHPKDKVVKTKIAVNGVEQVVADKLLKAVTINSPGINTVTYTIETEMGKTAQATNNVDVDNNLATNCNFSKTWSNNNLANIKINCEDIDGFVKNVDWVVNGTPLINKGNSISVGLPDDEQSVVVSALVTDNSNRTESFNTTVLRPSSGGDVPDAPTPLVYTFELKPALKVNRAPMKYSVKSFVSGGHRKDTPLESVVTINGVASPPVKGLPRMIEVESAGTSTVDISVLTKMGNSATATSTIDVNNNQTPDCDFEVSWDKTGKTAIVKLLNVNLRPGEVNRGNCSDPDGKVKKLNWIVDGVPSRRGGFYFMVPLSDATPSASVSVDVTDDSDETVRFSTSVSMP